ncbi:MAG TPA: enoyl-CoA hydratase/isomerase family protein [Candidatus Angelobacter sp.]|nr:enoyl-CoA hydratase/isomerase family protein [Candidatus Angelobacter sp.]
MNKSNQFLRISRKNHAVLLQITSPDHTNKLALQVVLSLIDRVEQLRLNTESGHIRGLIITGSDKFFSAGADLNEIARLTGPEALAFSRAGQTMTNSIDRFPVPVIAAIRGYCMGGGMDLALACDYRIASPDIIFGHRGASLGLITGWGGTQRLPRLIGKPRALQMFVMAERVKADEALAAGLINEIHSDPVTQALRRVESLPPC